MGKADWVNDTNLSQSNLSVCKYAMENGLAVAILAKTRVTVGMVKRIWFDDNYDQVDIEEEDGKHHLFSNDQITLAKLTVM